MFLLNKLCLNASLNALFQKKIKRKYRFLLVSNLFRNNFSGNTQYRFLMSNLIEKPTLCTTKAAIDTLKISTIAPRSRGEVCVCNKVAIEIKFKSIWILFRAHYVNT